MGNPSGICPPRKYRFFMDGKLKKKFEIVCGVLSALALFAIMVLTFLDVSGRKIWSQSIPGSLEVTELLMVVVIFGALPLVSLKGEHVVFDSLDVLLPRQVQKIQQGLIQLACAALMLALAYLMWSTGADFAAAGETTAQLKIAKAPFIQGMGVLCGLTGLVHLAKPFWPTEDESSEGCTL